MADTGSSSSKRKVSDAFVPDSMTSYLMGALRDNFNHLKTHMQHNCTFVVTNATDGNCTKQLLEELFRYLYLLADSSSDGVIRSSPSYFVNEAFHCLMLDPVLYLKVCDEILSMQGKDTNVAKVRVFPHDALSGNGDDEERRIMLYADTVARYKVNFNEDPPTALWGEYKPMPTPTEHTAAVSVPSVESTSLTPIHKDKGLKETVTLRITGSNDRSFDMEVISGDRFAEIIGRLAQHQRRDPKELELTYRRLTLRGYMMPYSFNMKDGEVISCNQPLYSTKKIAARAAAAAAATVYLSATVTGQAATTTSTNTSATVLSTSSTHNPVLQSTPALNSAVSEAVTRVAVVTIDTNMEETTRAMGVSRDKCLSILIFQDDVSMTNILARSGEVLLGEVIAAYTAYKGFALIDCTFMVCGLGLNPTLLDPEARVNSWPFGMHIKCTHVPPAVPRTITIIIQYHGEEKEVHVKVKISTPMSKIMQTYAEHQGVEAKVLMFYFGHALLRPEDTPESVGMKDNDKIVVQLDIV